jgi:hypothetical protein
VDHVSTEGDVTGTWEARLITAREQICGRTNGWTFLRGHSQQRRRDAAPVMSILNKTFCFVIRRSATLVGCKKDNTNADASRFMTA